MRLSLLFLICCLQTLSAATWDRFADNVIIPQRRSFAVPNVQRVNIERIHATVRIEDQIATTTLDIFLRNPHSQQLEAEVLLPLPANASVHRFDFKGAGKEPSARLLSHEEARKTYDQIVAQMRDPALLEFIDYQLLRSSVFPVPARGTQQLRISYETVLIADGDRIDYLLPRSQSIDCKIPWTIDVQLNSSRSIATCYSPSHQLQQKIINNKQQQIQISQHSLQEPGSFRLSFLLHGTNDAISYFAYPDPSINGGYLLMLAAPKARVDDKPMKRCVQLVIDRSGSMHSGKMDAIKEACLQILAGLNDGELVNVISYNEYINSFANKPCVLNQESRAQLRAYIQQIRPQGGTNIHDALYAGLQQAAPADTLPLMLFLTDGIPTIGNTNELDIRNIASTANPHAYRIFSVGVGHDVNTPLLQELADRSRARATFLDDQTTLELSIASLFNKLQSPTMTNLKAHITSTNEQAAPARVSDFLPHALPDLFKNDQLLCVARYQGTTPFIINIAGDKQTLRCLIDPKKASVQHAFVPRIWATHHIAVLLDAIRDSGVDPQSAAHDPRINELIKEVIRLSTQFGVLTEYTAFFAREGTALHEHDMVFKKVHKEIAERAFGSRSGAGSYNQDANLKSARESFVGNKGNRYIDKDLQEKHIDNVQALSNNALYQRGTQWVDSRLINKNPSVNIDESIAFGSARHLEVARSLAKQGQQSMLAQTGDIIIAYEERVICIKSSK